MGGAIGNLGIQSYCFRGFKQNAEVIARLKECGTAAIELCRAHADFSNPSLHDGVIAEYRKAGVAILSIGVERVGADPAPARPVFEFARKAGAKFMSIDFPVGSAPSDWRVAESLADEYDLRLGIHNHGGRHWLGCSAMLAHVFAHTGPRIGLCLDTAWALDSGEDPVKMVRQFGARLHGLHLKDFVFDRARKHRDVPVGTGNLDLRALAAALGETGFKGFTVIEYEGDVDNPVPALKECVQNVRQAMS